MTLRMCREVGTWDVEWWWYAPPGWDECVRRAPRELLKEAHLALNFSDEMQREDRRRCEADIAFYLEAMRSDPDAARRLIEWIELRFDKGSTPREAVERFRKEACGDGCR